MRRRLRSAAFSRAELKGGLGSTPMSGAEGAAGAGRETYRGTGALALGDTCTGTGTETDRGTGALEDRLLLAGCAADWLVLLVLLAGGSRRCRFLAAGAGAGAGGRTRAELAPWAHRLGGDLQLILLLLGGGGRDSGREGG